MKRNGTVVPLEINKIRNVINWAMKDIQLSPMKLESNLELTFKAKMTSVEIHQSLINSAVKMVSLDEPEWTTVAARLKVLEMYKDVSKNRGYSDFGYSSYPQFVNYMVSKKLYDNTLMRKYSLEHLDLAGTFIDPANDLLFDYAGVVALNSKYLMKNGKKLVELPQELFITLALYIEQDQPSAVRMDRVLETYNMLARRKISLATPILLNLRKPEGNLSSCFITAMDDNLNSIYYVLDQCARISQNGGGVGINVSRVRSLGASIRGVPEASGGVIPWIKLIDNTTVAVNQLGKRPGAMTVALDIWHRDIEDFLELQTENGDLNMKAFKIHPQIVIPDEFMRRLENGQDWTLFDPHEVKTVTEIDLVQLHGEAFTVAYKTLEADSRLKLRRTINTKELVTRILKCWVETGHPYIAFKDTMNRYNPNKGTGTILNANLCVESYSNTSPSKVRDDNYLGDYRLVRQVKAGDLHTCNLCSINLAFTEDDEMKKTCETAVRILDNLIDLTTTPVLEGQLHNQKYRTIGVGFMGYADYTVKKGVPYSMSAELADKLFEDLAYYCTVGSMNLAKERGTFDSYELSEYPKGILLGKDADWFVNNTENPDRWLELLENIKQYGIRNSQITAIAPNTSTSLLQGCTASVLPIYGKFYMDGSKITTPIVPPFIKNNFWTYQENKNIDQRKVIDVVSNIQKWIDTGISMEFVLNPNMDFVNAKYIYELFLTSWKKECKTIYYVRNIQNKTDEDCVSCSG